MILGGYTQLLHELRTHNLLYPHQVVLIHFFFLKFERNRGSEGVSKYELRMEREAKKSREIVIHVANNNYCPPLYNV